MKKKILVVEDEQMLSEAYELILKKEGYDVKTASDGEEALTVTEKFTPDLILLDLRMPKMGGLEFLGEYNPPKQHPEVKIIVFSNLDTQDEIDEAYQLGAHHYILKSWASPKELIQLVKDMFKK